MPNNLEQTAEEVEIIDFRNGEMGHWNRPGFIAALKLRTVDGRETYLLAVEYTEDRQKSYRVAEFTSRDGIHAAYECALNDLKDVGLVGTETYDSGFGYNITPEMIRAASEEHYQKQKERRAQ